jgi:hypothetical protein
VVADGDPHFGMVKEGNTSSIPQYPPQVTTGAAEYITDTSMKVCHNLMTENGDSGICEYGLLYTQISSLANIQNLHYTNYPSTVCMKYVCSDIPEYVDYMNELTGLSDNTSTYFRAFAINGVDIAYGSINTSNTLPINVVPVTVALDGILEGGVSNACGDIKMTPALSGTESVNISLSVDHCGLQSGDVACTQISCGTPPTNLYLCDMVYGDLFTPETISFTMNVGDVVKWDHYVTGDANTKGKIITTEVSTSSPTIAPIIYGSGCQVVVGGVTNNNNTN